MTGANVLIYVALIGYILYQRVQGRPVKEGRRLFVLPIVLIVLGFTDVTQGTSAKPFEVALTVIGAAISLGLGLLRGRADKLSQRNGAAFVQWGAASLLLFATNIVAKLVLDVIGLAAGSTSSAVEKSLLLTFGLTLLGEAIVLWMRTGDASSASNPPRPRAAASARPSTGHAGDLADSVPVAASSAGVTRDLGDALLSHHERHRQRHQARHHRDNH